jgi:hypothetical protein
MTVHQIHQMLRDLDDTQELVLEAPHTDDDHDDPLVLAWRAAACHAAWALDAWRARGGRDAYATYRALADQADAAQETLQSSAARRPRSA